MQTERESFLFSQRLQLLSHDIYMSYVRLLLRLDNALADYARALKDSLV